MDNVHSLWKASFVVDLTHQKDRLRQFPGQLKGKRLLTCWYVPSPLYSASTLLRVNIKKALIKHYSKYHSKFKANKLGQCIHDSLLQWENIRSNFLRKKKLIWGLWFQKINPQRQGRCGNRQLMQEAKRSYLQSQHKAEKELEIGWGYKLSKLSPTMYFLQQNCTYSPDSTNNWEPSVQIPGPMKDIFQFKPPGVISCESFRTL